MSEAVASQSGRVVLITGANTGIGKVTAQVLASAGAHVFIACRSAERARPVRDELRVATGNDRIELLSLDLADLASVRACAAEFLARDVPLHILINNGGVGGQRGLSSSGFELAFGVNHVGHFLLTRLLLPRLRESAPARVVTVASRAHYRARGIDFERIRARTSSVTGTPEYAVSKLANVLFSAELGRRLEGTGVTTYALHPGVVATDIWRALPWPARPLVKLAMLTPEQGAATTLHCATSTATAQETALYYDKSRPVTPSAVARDAELARRLWEQSEAWTQV